MNRDGRTDLIRINKDGHLAIAWTDSDNKIGKWDYSTSGYGSIKDHQFYFADLNNDGREDLIRLNKDGHLAVAWTDSDNKIGKWDYSTSGYGSIRDHHFYVADLNKDGRADLIRINKDGHLAVAWTDSDNKIGKWDYSASGYGSIEDHQFLFADLNKDGKADLIRINKDGHLAVAWTDSDNKIGKWDYSTSGYGSIRDHHFYVTDLNKDGHLVVAWTDSNNKIGKWDYSATGYGSIKDHQFFFADLNKDGRKDLIRINEEGNICIAYHN